MTGAGFTFGANKIWKNSRHSANPPHPIPAPWKLPASSWGNKSVKLNMLYLLCLFYTIVFVFMRCKTKQIILFRCNHFPKNNTFFILRHNLSIFYQSRWQYLIHNHIFAINVEYHGKFLVSDQKGLSLWMIEFWQFVNALWQDRCKIRQWLNFLTDSLGISYSGFHRVIWCNEAHQFNETFLDIVRYYYNIFTHRFCAPLQSISPQTHQVWDTC